MLTLILQLISLLGPAATPTNFVAEAPPLCSCGPYVEDFCVNVRSGSTVILVAILEVDSVYRGSNLSQSMRVSILDDLTGTASGSEGFVRGGSGNLCEQDLRVFAAGDTTMLSVYRDSTSSQYFLPGLCGRYFAKVNNGRVEGRRVAAFKEDFAACLAKTSSTSEIEQKAVAVTADRASQLIRIESPEVRIADYVLYNATGQVMSARRGLDVHTATLPAHDLSAGIYSLRVRTSVGEVTRRFYWAQ